MREFEQRSIAAQEQQVALLTEQVRAVQDIRDREEREHRDREYEALRRPLRKLARGVGIPVAGDGREYVGGFLALWEREVPDKHMHEERGRDGSVTRILRCACGSLLALPSTGTAKCSCHRWFLALPREVRVRRFAEEDAA